MDGSNASGPHLDGVIGRKPATVPGFACSEATKAVGYAWPPETLNLYLIKPSAIVPGTAMSFDGLKKMADRNDTISYRLGLPGQAGIGSEIARVDDELAGAGGNYSLKMGHGTG